MGRIYTVDKLRRSQRSGANRHAWAQLQNIRTHLEHVTGEDLVTLAMKKSLRITSLTLDLRLEQRELPFKPLGENAWKELREIEVPKRWQYPDDLDLPHVQADPELQSLALTNHIYDRLGCGIKEPFHDDSMMPFRRAGIEYIRFEEMPHFGYCGIGSHWRKGKGQIYYRPGEGLQDENFKYPRTVMRTSLESQEEGLLICEATEICLAILLHMNKPAPMVKEDSPILMVSCCGTTASCLIGYYDYKTNHLMIHKSKPVDLANPNILQMDLLLRWLLGPGVPKPKREEASGTEDEYSEEFDN